MSTNNQESIVKEPSLIQQLLDTFGPNKTISAEYREAGGVTFYEKETQITFGRRMPEDAIWFGPGNYKIVIGEDSYTFELVE